MGMDVYGKKPSSKRGKYFYMTMSGWHPLATLVTTLCPTETAACKYWHTNDGDGLDAVGARALADALQEKINKGEVRAYIKLREAELKAMPNEPCCLCAGTGIRRDIEDEINTKIPSNATWNGIEHPRAGQLGWCNGCDGLGFRRPYETHYKIEEDSVRKFVTFLRDSGGFEIH